MAHPGTTGLLLAEIHQILRCFFGKFIITQDLRSVYDSGLSSLGVPGVPWHTQILADQLTLFQPGGTDYAHLITTGTPGFSYSYLSNKRVGYNKRVG